MVAFRTCSWHNPEAVFSIGIEEQGWPEAADFVMPAPCQTVMFTPIPLRVRGWHVETMLRESPRRILAGG